MIKLRSGNTYLDVVDDGSLQITKSVQDVEDFTARTSSFSQNFLLPFTPNNNTFFAHFYNVSSKPDSTLFDATKREPIIIEDDGIIVMEGYMQLIQADPIARTYEVVCFDDVLELKNQIENKTLRDIAALSELDHDFDADNIILSFSGDLLDGNVKYPIVNYGQDEPTRDAMFDFSFRPWVRLKWIFDQIIKEAGFTYSSDFLENDERFKKIYFSWATEGLITKSGFENYAFRARGTTTSDQFIGFGNLALNSVTFEAIDGTPILGTGLSEINIPAANPPFNNTTNTFDPSGAGRHDLRVVLKITRSPSVQNFPQRVTCYLYPTQLLTAAHPFGQQSIAITQTLDVSQEGLEQILVFEFPNIGLQNQFVLPPFGTINQLGYNVEFSTEGLVAMSSSPPNQNFVNIDYIYWEMLAPPGAQPNFETDMFQSAPEMGQLDIVRGVINHFNLFAEVDPVNESHIIFKPYNDYIDTGNVVDWTDKVDLSQGISVRPATELQKATAKWAFSQDSNTDQSENRLGSRLIKNDNDFTEGEELVELPYGEPTQFIINRPPNNVFRTTAPTYILAAINDGVIQPTSFIPRIAYIQAVEQGVNDYPPVSVNQITIIDTVNASLRTPTSFAFANQVYFEAGETFFDLTFNRTNNFGRRAALDPPADEDAYTAFWQRYVNEIYNNEAKVVEADFMLTPSDILTFRFNDRVFFKDTFYRVLEIQNYAVGQRQSTRVKMVSLVGEAASPWNDCDGIVTEFNSDGSVTFSGSNTEECCRRYGYQFINGTCSWRPRSGWTGAPILPPPPQTTLPGAGQPSTGACCYNDGETDTCAITTESQCTLLGGNWLGQNTDCTQCIGGLTPPPFDPE